MSLFEKHNGDIRSQVGINKSSATLQKYENAAHFSVFLNQSIIVLI